MQKFLKNNLVTIIGIVVGMVAGYFYWQQIGCALGTCAITSSPIHSILFGAAMGGLLFSMFQKEKIDSKI